MHHYGISFVKNGTASFFCPECGVSLIEDNSRCPVCSSSIFAIAVPGKGKWRGCASFGCSWQKWDAVDQGGDRQFVEISIIDSGCGIPQDEIAKIFEPFYSTKGQKGTGLGLAVVWGIMDAHEGKISVKSAVGKGTTFTVRLPVEQPRSAGEKTI
jgi:signal transduction histidine kinase